ncbi:MmcQ/YjbR family DNA-binding protein [Lactococcus ileimucosae]|uniref:MmcQ/YjbR family DNA-binding protein n=1 Tax=Lactococcus ileimucosae TaxID=2941329 RepID=A0ABV4D3B5_9LACT
MERQELINLVLKLTNSYEDYPFNNNNREKILWTAIRQKSNKKIICLIFEKDNELLIDLKLSPEHGEEARQISGVFPGYHMNKTHWNTVSVNHTALTQEGLIQMIKESDNLTQK